MNAGWCYLSASVSFVIDTVRKSYRLRDTRRCRISVVVVVVVVVVVGGKIPKDLSILISVPFPNARSGKTAQTSIILHDWLLQ